jgi:PTS system nitrogen regulatory IIA component
MDLFDCFLEECVNIDSTAKDKDSILRDIAETAKKSSRLENFSSDDIYEALKQREEVGSTGFEDGVAIPHCRLEGLDSFVVGLVLVPGGLDFGSYDKKPSELFFFILGPEDQAMRNQHIRLLSAISRTLAIRGVKEELKEAKSSEELRELFLRWISDKMESSPDDEKSFFFISVQEEDKFIDILEAVSALADSVSVIEGHDATQYLHSLPVFSSFWNSEDKGFHRVISGLVGKKLSNEMVRGVNVAADGLDNKSGVLVVLLDAAYSAGALRS